MAYATKDDLNALLQKLQDQREITNDLRKSAVEFHATLYGKSDTDEKGIAQMTSLVSQHQRQIDDHRAELDRHQQYLEIDLSNIHKQIQDRIAEVETTASTATALVNSWVASLEKRDGIESRLTAALESLASNARSIDSGKPPASGRHSAEDLPGKRSMVILKNIAPDKLTKEAEWRRWHEQVEDYSEEIHPGMKAKLREVRHLKEIASKETIGEVWWQCAEQLYRFLKAYTSDNMRKTIENVTEDNGWEAWRLLEIQCEPAVGVKQAHVFNDFTALIKQTAKKTRETRKMLTEFEQKARRIAEVTGKDTDIGYAKSVLQGIIDPETLKHCAQYFTTVNDPADLTNLKSKILEFINMVDYAGSGGAPMKKVAEPEGECSPSARHEDWPSDDWWPEGEEWPQEGESPESDPDKLAALRQGNCNICGGKGHHGRDCPNPVLKGEKSKGKGKGKAKGGGAKASGAKAGGKGGGKTGGKGGPKNGGCWNCGGAHFQAQCPHPTRNNNQQWPTKSISQTEGPKRLVKLVAVTPSVSPDSGGDSVSVSPAAERVNTCRAPHPGGVQPCHNGGEGKNSKHASSETSTATPAELQARWEARVEAFREMCDPDMPTLCDDDSNDEDQHNGSNLLTAGRKPHQYHGSNLLTAGRKPQSADSNPLTAGGKSQADIVHELADYNPLAAGGKSHAQACTEGCCSLDGWAVKVTKSQKRKQRQRDRQRVHDEAKQRNINDIIEEFEAKKFARSGFTNPRDASVMLATSSNDGACSRIGDNAAVGAHSANRNASISNKTGNLNLLIAHATAPMKAIAEAEEWVELEFGVDSGASQSVLAPSDLPHIEAQQGKHYGTKYEVASGEFIFNQGENNFVICTENGVERTLPVQVTDVNQPLLSVREMLEQNNRVVFDSDGSYILDKDTSEVIPLGDDGKMYLMKVWCRKSGF